MAVQNPHCTQVRKIASAALPALGSVLGKKAKNKAASGAADAQVGAAQMGIDGLVVMSTVEGSPAARAGLRGVDQRSGALGDVIVSANGKPVRRLAELARALQDAGVGKSVRIGVLRGSRTIEIDLDVVDIRER